jgi:2-keto-3-deoxy-L-rhamnonate aldolase RhmA
MRQNRVKRVMRENGLALVSHVGFADPAVVEIIALSGFDGAFIDMEHSGFDFQMVGDMMVPHIEGVEDAKRAVAAVRYPPLGERGAAGSTRAAGYGSIAWRDHVQTSNEEILLTVMTEDLRGIGDIEAIAALDGVDLISLAPTDLSMALGITDPTDPRLRQTIEELVQKVQRIGKAKVYVPVYHPAFYLTPKELLQLGVNYTSVAPPPPTIVLQALRESAQRIRAETGQ